MITAFSFIFLLVGDLRATCPFALERLNRYAEELEDLRSGGVKEVFENKIITDTRRRVYGVPSDVVRFQHQGFVFRHYTTPEGYPRILESRSLIAGPRSLQSGGDKFFVDLTGVQFTRPSVPASGVLEPWESKQAIAIDFTLDPQIPVYAFGDRAFFVYGPHSYPNWIIEEYSQYLRQPESLKHESLIPLFRRFAELGEIPVPVRVPIQILE